MCNFLSTQGFFEALTLDSRLITRGLKNHIYFSIFSNKCGNLRPANQLFYTENFMTLKLAILIQNLKEQGKFQSL